MNEMKNVDKTQKKRSKKEPKKKSVVSSNKKGRKGIRSSTNTLNCLAQMLVPHQSW